MTQRAAVRIRPETIRGLVAHARRARPREACGFLVGRGARVAFSVPVRNIARGLTRYRADPAEHLALRRALRELVPALEIVGVYHSHPRGRTWPSETDIAEALYPDWIHVIVGLAGRRAVVRAFVMTRGRVRRLAIARVSNGWSRIPGSSGA